MALLNEDLRRQLAEFFSRQLQDPVTLHFFTQKSSLLSVPAQECHTCREAGELLEEVVSLSDKFKLQVFDLVSDSEEARRLGVDKIPGLVMQGRNKGTLRYFGVPAGYEFGVMVEDFVDLSRGTTPLSATTREQLGGLTRFAHIKVLVTPT